MLATMGCLCLNGLPLALGFDFERIQQAFINRFGAERNRLLQEWQRLLGEAKKAPETDKLKRVNDFFNRRIAFDDDMSIWGQNDYWATPSELIGQGRGDCEDFSIAKYYSLIDLGVPVTKLRLVYVKAAQNGPDGVFLQAHMVLAYYATPAGPRQPEQPDPACLPAQRSFTDFQFQQHGPLARHRQQCQQKQSFPLAGLAGQGSC